MTCKQLHSYYWTQNALGILLLLTCSACQPSVTSEVKPSSSPNLPTLPPQTLKLDRKPQASPIYSQAIAASTQATELSQNAQSVEDWQTVTEQWQKAITLMKQVPTEDPNHAAAIQNLALLQEGVARSKTEVKRLQDQAIVQASQNKTVQALEDATQRLKTQSERSIAPAANLYRAKIKSYRNGIPVIDVMFNGSQQFEMMVDTGASSTMITESMSQSLKVQPFTSVLAKTPSGETVFPVGRVESIAVGQSAVQDVPVAIGPVGLLGHDFFGDCNINIKRDQDLIEFSKCQE